MSQLKTYAIILASGKGERFGSVKPKQFMKLAGKTILEHTIDVFEHSSIIDVIYLIVHSQWIPLCEDFIIKNHYKKVSKILIGGSTRQESSCVGISAIPEEEANVLIHDAVRPFVNGKTLQDCVEALKHYAAVDLAIPSADTLIQVNDKSIIEHIPERRLFRRGQTPQAFLLSVIKKAHLLAKSEPNLTVTDDCGLVTHFSLSPVYVINGSEDNIKITLPIDMSYADKLFQLKSRQWEPYSLNTLLGKVLVVFGASKGIGKAIVDLARRHGANVFGYSRSNGYNVKNRTDIINALSTTSLNTNGRIDYIVNTAGILNMGTLVSRLPEDIHEEFLVNFMGCVNIAQIAYPFLQKSQGSLAFFTSSSYTRGRALYSTYSSCKAGIVNFVQALSEEWSNDNIRINAINPERTATPMRSENFGIEPPETLLNPSDVALATLSTLISHETGQVVDVRRTSSLRGEEHT